MISLLPVQCRACSRYRTRPAGTCEAYPGGIPVEIITYGGDHRQAHRGDHGLRFKPADTAAAREALEQWESTFGNG